jgi:hypothetical protein
LRVVSKSARNVANGTGEFIVVLLRQRITLIIRTQSVGALLCQVSVGRIISVSYRFETELIQPIVDSPLVGHFLRFNQIINSSLSRRAQMHIATSTCFSLKNVTPRNSPEQPPKITT